MSNTLNVVSQVRAGLKKLDWVQKLADELERIGSLEQAERETSERLVKLKDREAFVLQEIETKVKEAEKIDKRAKEVQSTAEEVLSKAHKRSQEIYKEAEKRSAKIVAEAKDFRSGADRTYDLLVKEAEERLKILVDKEKAAEHRVKASEDRVKTADANLVTIESRIQNARDKAIKAYQEEFKNYI